MTDDASPPTPAERLAAIFQGRALTLAVAEGATGGYLAHLLTQVPGSSSWFRAGLVTYTDYPKQLLLRVSTETIAERGSISAETTVQMARLTRRLFGTDWSIALTGYAGDTAPAAGPRAPGVPSINPAGVPRVEAERREPAAGLTYVAMSTAANTAQGDAQYWEEWELPAPDREGYKRAAAEAAIELLIKLIREQDEAAEG